MAATKLVVADQQTIVIGGLIRNVVGRTEEKVPVLGDIPVLGALFRKRTNQNEKRNLILVLTPYIIRSQSDLRTVFERKMQERQEFLDRYFVFGEASEYVPPKDWSRTNGLVEDIRQAYFRLEEQRKLAEIARPKPLEAHPPQAPLDLPQRMPARRGAGARHSRAETRDAFSAPRLPPSVCRPGPAAPRGRRSTARGAGREAQISTERAWSVELRLSDPWPVTGTETRRRRRFAGVSLPSKQSSSAAARFSRRSSRTSPRSST